MNHLNELQRVSTTKKTEIFYQDVRAETPFINHKMEYIKKISKMYPRDSHQKRCFMKYYILLNSDCSQYWISRQGGSGQLERTDRELTQYRVLGGYQHKLGPNMKPSNREALHRESTPGFSSHEPSANYQLLPNHTKSSHRLTWSSKQQVNKCSAGP